MKETKWERVEDAPKYSDLYNVCCSIGSMGGGYTDVRSYEYDKKSGQWILPKVSDEIITVTYWAELPEPPNTSIH